MINEARSARASTHASLPLVGENRVFLNMHRIQGRCKSLMFRSATCREQLQEAMERIEVLTSAAAKARVEGNIWKGQARDGLAEVSGRLREEQDARQAACQQATLLNSLVEEVTHVSIRVLDFSTGFQVHSHFVVSKQKSRSISMLTHAPACQAACPQASLVPGGGGGIFDIELCRSRRSGNVYSDQDHQSPARPLARRPP